jgi:hypothetical protein
VQSLRYLGSTLGVALVVAFTSGVTGDALDGFHHLWWLLIACGIAVSVLSTRLARPTATVPTRPELAASTAR